MKAYKLYSDAKDYIGYTGKDIAALIDVSYSTFCRQIKKLKDKPESCNVIFLNSLCLCIQLKLGDLLKAIELEYSDETKKGLKRIEDFVKEHEARMARLTEKQRTAFHPNPPPKTFLTITVDRLN